MKARFGRTHRNLICTTYNSAPMTFAGIAHISMATSAPLTYFQAVVLGLLQGVTELFPISSLGHTVLFPTLFGWDSLVKAQSDPESFWLAFVVMLHVGSAIGLLIYFWRDWVEIVRAFFRTLARRRIETTTEKLAWLIIATTIPTGILGLVLEHPVRVALAKPTAAAVFLMINGLILLGAERLRRRAEVRALAARSGPGRTRAVTDLSYSEGVGIGFAQSTALIAGSLAADVSQGFRWTGSGLKPQAFEFTTQTAPAEAGSSTAADMARYLMAILGDGTLGGQTIYSAAIAKDFRTPLLRSAPGAPAWDYGMLEYPLPGGHVGYGRDGGAVSFRASLITIPHLELGVFAAANTETGGPFVRGLSAAIVQRFYAPAPEPIAGSQWLLDNASAFKGGYLTTARAYRGLEGFVDRFRGRARVEVDKSGFLLTPGPGGPERWVPAADASTDAPYVTFRQADGPGVLVFQMTDGRGVRWFAPTGEAVYERAAFLSRRDSWRSWRRRRPSRPWRRSWAWASATGATSARPRSRRVADGTQISASILWLTALACFGIFDLSASRSRRPGRRLAERLAADRVGLRPGGDPRHRAGAGAPARRLARRSTSGQLDPRPQGALHRHHGGLRPVRDPARPLGPLEPWSK